MKVLFPYRLITGSKYCPKCDAFHFIAHHMTFYAADRATLMYLITVSDAPNGKIFSALQVETDKETFTGFDSQPSAN